MYSTSNFLYSTISCKAQKVIITILTIFLFMQNANASFEVIGSLINKKNVEPGATYTTQIKIRGTGQNQQELRIYQSDYMFDYTGKSTYAEPVSHDRSNAGWIEYDPKNLILSGNEVHTVNVKISVPENKKLTGTYWSLIMIEGLSLSNQDEQGQLHINTAIRYAVQIVTNIGQTGTGLLEFNEPVVVREEQQNHFSFILFNPGERSISPEVSLELFDLESGESVKKMNSEKFGLFPGTSKMYEFSLEGILPKKEYQAIIIADGSGDDIFGLEYNFRL